jgi:hypothetical protein
LRLTIAAARDDQHRDGPLRDSLGNIVKDGKPKGGAWAGGGGKKGEWVEKRVWTREEIDDQDSDFGYEKFLDGGTKEGWLITFSPTTITHPETSKEIAAVECYLTMQVLQPRASATLALMHLQDGSKFKCLLLHKPYFYVSVVEINRAEMREIDNIIRKKYSDFIVDTQVLAAVPSPVLFRCHNTRSTLRWSKKKILTCRITSVASGRLT